MQNMNRNVVASIVALLTLAACSYGQQPASNAGSGAAPANRPVDAGVVAGWHGGDAVVYATVGFFAPTPLIVAVGAIEPDGSFRVDYPSQLPQDVLARPAQQCSTIQASNAAALTAFTGNDLVFQHGTLIGALHSGSSRGVASFTSIAAGDTRTGYVYASAGTTQTGTCDRKVTLGAYTLDFRQNFDLKLHRGWNTVVADFSTPSPGVVVSDLKLGSNPDEKFFFFGASNP